MIPRTSIVQRKSFIQWNHKAEPKSTRPKRPLSTKKMWLSPQRESSSQGRKLSNGTGLNEWWFDLAYHKPLLTVDLEFTQIDLWVRNYPQDEPFLKKKLLYRCLVAVPTACDVGHSRSRPQFFEFMPQMVGPHHLHCE